MRPFRWIIAFAALALAGCGASEEPSSTLTEHQRDSVIARSDLPGARVVSRALAESQRGEIRSAKLDSLGR